MGRKSVFVDSSLALPLLGKSTKQQNSAFQKTLGKRTPRRSVFLRKEFIWRLIREAFRASSVLRSRFHDDPTGGLEWLNQEFGGRASKNIVTLLAESLRNGASLTADSLADEFLRTGRRLLKLYDRTMGKPLHNNSHCQIGEMRLVVDFRRPHLALQAIDEAAEHVSECNVQKILQIDTSSLPQTTTARNLKSCQKANPFSCGQCKRVGDAVIALELPDKGELLACDRDLISLTTALGKKAAYVSSIRGLEPGSR